MKKCEIMITDNKFSVTKPVRESLLKFDVDTIFLLYKWHSLAHEIRKMCGVLKNSKLQPCFHMYFSEDHNEHRSCLSNKGLKKEEGDFFLSECNENHKQKFRKMSTVMQKRRELCCFFVRERVSR